MVSSCLNLKKNEKSIWIDKVMPGNMGWLFCETPCILLYSKTKMYTYYIIMSQH